MQGPLQINSRFGDVEGAHLSGKVEVHCKRAAVRLRNIEADCAVWCAYGQVQLATTASTGQVWIKGEKSDVQLDLSSPPLHQVFLIARYGHIRASGAFQHIHPDANTQKATLRGQTAGPLLTVETSFGDIQVGIP